jgi:hypothetical protein
MQVNFYQENREKLRFAKIAADCDFRSTEKIRNKKKDICNFKQISHCTIQNCKEKGKNEFRL